MVLTKDKVTQCPKRQSFSYIFVANTTVLASVNLTLQMAPKAATFGEMTHINGHYVMQGHIQGHLGMVQGIFQQLELFRRRSRV